MKLNIFLTTLLSFCFSFVIAQNEKPNREEYALNLPVNGEQFYEQKILASPYIVKEKTLQIYPGEKLFIEGEVNKNEFTSMKVVKENLNPSKTIEIELYQNVKDNKHESMMLKIVNPFEKELEYKAIMYIVGHYKWINTSILPVMPKLVGYETWTDVIISLVLTDWKLK